MSYRRAIVGAVVLPPVAEGRVEVEIKVAMKTDTKTAPGKAGSGRTQQGEDDAPVTLRCVVPWRHREALRTAWRALWPPGDPKTIEHPKAADANVSSVLFESGTPPGEVGTGLFGFELVGKSWSLAADTACGLLLAVGSHNAEVGRWQTFLAERGYDVGNVDTIFGSQTKTATMAFQTAEGAKVDGIVGPETFGKAAKYGYAPPTPDACKKLTGTRTPTKADPAADGAEYGPPTPEQYQKAVREAATREWEKNGTVYTEDGEGLSSDFWADPLLYEVGDAGP